MYNRRNSLHYLIILGAFYKNDKNIFFIDMKQAIFMSKLNSCKMKKQYSLLTNAPEMGI